MHSPTFFRSLVWVALYLIELLFIPVHICRWFEKRKYIPPINDNILLISATDLAAKIRKKQSGSVKTMAMNVTLPTLYEYYTAGGINAGLLANQPYFTLNDKNITLYGGAMHYFRVPKPYWRDSLRKMRAAGLNTVETYVPWNLHEPQPEKYDFGNGGTDMEDFLDLPHFLQLAKEEDLLAIVRPGPFICAEWEFGGLPSWLLREENIRIRTSDQKFMKHAKRFISVVLHLLSTLLFINGGPVVAVQVENEYASVLESADHSYIEELYQIFVDSSLEALLFTSDSPFYGTVGTIPDKLLQTANFDQNAKSNLDKLNTLQSNKPNMVMEYWSGWFDHWAEPHQNRSAEKFADILEDILKYPSSVNMYMFRGGTNFGFLNGANVHTGKYQPVTTSYDYDSAISETGDYSEKYFKAKELIRKYNPVETKLPSMPELKERMKYPDLELQEYLLLDDLINQLPEKYFESFVKPMELLPCNNNSGQAFGYTIYRKTGLDIKANSRLTIKGKVHDFVLVLVNQKLLNKKLEKASDINAFGYWITEDSSIVLSKDLTGATLDIVTLNMGRNNYGKLSTFIQHKGLQSDVVINNGRLEDWEILPMEFKSKWTNALTGWKLLQGDSYFYGPVLYKVSFVLEEAIDTFVNMENWTMGIVIINDFVLGKYMKIGPQQALYLPAPLLRVGVNNLLVFEHFEAAKSVSFSKNPINKLIV